MILQGIQLKRRYHKMYLKMYNLFTTHLTFVSPSVENYF